MAQRRAARVVPGERRALREHLSGEPGEEVLLDLADDPLHLALRLGPVRPARPGPGPEQRRDIEPLGGIDRGAVGAGSRHERRIPVGQELGRRPAEVVDAADDRAEGRRARLVGREADADHPRAAEDGHEGEQVGRPVAERPGPDVGPVALGLDRRAPSRSAGRARPRSPGGGRRPAGAGSCTSPDTRTRRRARAGGRSPAGRDRRPGAARRGRAGPPRARPVSPAGRYRGRLLRRSRTASRSASRARTRGRGRRSTSRGVRARAVPSRFPQTARRPSCPWLGAQQPEPDRGDLPFPVPKERPPGHPEGLCTFRAQLSAVFMPAHTDPTGSQHLPGVAATRHGRGGRLAICTATSQRRMSATSSRMSHTDASNRASGRRFRPPVSGAEPGRRAGSSSATTRFACAASAAVVSCTATSGATATRPRPVRRSEAPPRWFTARVETARTGGSRGTPIHRSGTRTRSARCSARSVAWTTPRSARSSGCTASTDHGSMNSRSPGSSEPGTRPAANSGSPAMCLPGRRRWRGSTPRSGAHCNRSRTDGYRRPRSWPTCARCPTLWADSGPHGPSGACGSIFARADVLGFQRLEYDLTPDAIDLGLDGALPPRAQGARALPSRSISALVNSKTCAASRQPPIASRTSSTITRASVDWSR